MIRTRPPSRGAVVDLDDGDMDIAQGRVLHLPAMDLLKAQQDGTVGAVITDPPFFISMHRDGGGMGDDPWAKGISTTDAMVEWSLPLAKEIHRTLRPGGACVVMGGSHSISAWQIAADRAGLVWMAELTVLWNTGKPRNRNFGSLTTTIRWHAKPGLRHTFNSGAAQAIYSNVLVCAKVPLKERMHVAQKPVELTNFLVSLLTRDTDLVVDPFCGSGSTLVSAAICGRRWLGGDTDLDQCRVAQTRAAQYELEAADLKDLYLWHNNKLTRVEG